MKIIFLDIDGVLNHETYYKKRYDAIGNRSWDKRQYPLDEICFDNVLLLNELIKTTSAKVVVSSTWRMGRTTEQLQNILNQCGFIGEVIDTTPHLFCGNKKLEHGYTIPRGCEIDYWLSSKGFQRINWGKEKQLEYLEKSEVKNYVILDDDSDMLYNQREHFVKCNAYKRGFDEDCLKKATEVLSMDLIGLYYKGQDI